MTKWRAASALLATLFLVLPAGSAAADAPTEVTFTFEFDDVDPCTGQIHSVSFEITAYQHHHDGRFVEHAKTTITTSPTGYVGGGTHTLQINEQNLVFRSNDMLANDMLDRIRVRIVVVLDLATDSVRVEEHDFTCVGG